MNANVRTNIRLQQAKLFFIGPELIQVIQSADEADTLLWQCELPGTEDGELALLQWLDDTRFLALGQNGLLFVCDYQACSCEQVLDLQISGTPGAWLDSHKQTLWVVGRVGIAARRGHSLLKVDLAAMEPVQHWPVSAEIEPESLILTRDGRVAFYGRNEHGGYRFRFQQLVYFDPSNETWSEQPLPGKPAPVQVSTQDYWFQNRANGLISTLAADGVSRHQAEGEPVRYEARLQLIDMNLGRQIDAGVRLPAMADICDEYDAEAVQEALERIAAGEMSHQDNDEWQQLLNSLTCSYFCEQEQVFWLGWKGGGMQKVSSKGERLSPLYQLGSQDAAGQWRPLSHYGGDLVMIKGVNQGRLWLAFGDLDEPSHYSVDIDSQAAVPQSLLAAEQQKCPLNCRSYQPKPLQIPSQLQAEPCPSGRVTLYCDDLTSNQGRLQLLQQLLAVLPKLEQTLGEACGAPLASVTARAPVATRVPVATRAGWLDRLKQKITHSAVTEPGRLWFAFVDGLGNRHSEYDFFHYAVRLEQGPELIAAILAAYCRLPQARCLLGAKGQPVLAEAALALSQHRQALPQLADYFNVLSALPVHPFHINRTLKVIFAEHQGSQELAAFLAAVPSPYNDPEFKLAEKGDYDDDDEFDEDDDYK